MLPETHSAPPAFFPEDGNAGKYGAKQFGIDKSRYPEYTDTGDGMLADISVIILSAAVLFAVRMLIIRIFYKTYTETEENGVRMEARELERKKRNGKKSRKR